MSWAVPLAVAFCGLAAGPAQLATGAAQDDAPPPAVEQNGVVNAASEMPAQFSGGSIARGSLFRVHGWRMGPKETVRPAGFPLPETLSGLAVEIRKGGVVLHAPVVSVSATRIEAILPSAAPPGDATLVVVRGGSRGDPFPFRVVPASFGAFHAPGQRWGQGLIRNGARDDDGVWNGLTDSAQPGSTVTLLGTGLGAAPGSDASAPNRVPVASPNLTITVGGKPVQKIHYTGRSAIAIGVDEITFDVPSGAPEGCHVPVQVRADAIASNFVSMAIRRGGGACTDAGDWIRSASEKARSAGLIILNHADVWFDLEDSGSTRFRVDSALARFVEDPPVHGSTDRMLSFPPPGTCTAREHIGHLRGMLTNLSPLDLMEGTPLDAGEQLTFRGAYEMRRIGKSQGSPNTYGGVLGGNPPGPTAHTFPHFLRPGTYGVSGDGPGTGAFEAEVEAWKPIRWTDRARIASVDRSRGVTVHWAAARKDSFVLIVAVNADNGTGALGCALCVAPAQPGRFTVPSTVLTNLPPTKPGPGLPFHTLWIIEVPGRAPKPFQGPRLDRGIAFYVSASGRTVSFR